MQYFQISVTQKDCIITDFYCIACWVYCKSKSTHELPLEGWKQYEKKKWLPVQKIELFEAVWESAFSTFDTFFYKSLLGKIFL